MMRYIITFILSTFTLFLSAQNQKVDMADGFYKEGKIYVVIVVASIVFLAVLLYLFLLDRRIKKLEKEVAGKKKENTD